RKADHGSDAGSADALHLCGLGTCVSQTARSCAAGKGSRFAESGFRIAGTGASVASYRQRLLPCEGRSEEHTSELQSRENLVCRLLLEKKKPGHAHHSP